MLQLKPLIHTEDENLHEKCAGHILVINDYFAYIAIPKTGSRHLEGLFLKNGVKYMTSGMNGVPNLYLHSTAYEIKNYLLKHKWSRSFSFCVFRNPFIRAISRFHHLKRVSVISNDMTFSHYVMKHCMNDKHMYQSTFIVDTDGKILVKKIYRIEDGIESIINDLNKRFPILEMKIYDDIFKHENPSGEKYNVKEYFNNEDLVKYFVNTYKYDFLLGRYDIKIK